MPQETQRYTITASMIETFNRAIGEPQNIATEASSLIAVTCVQTAIHEAIATRPHTFLTQSLKFRSPVYSGDCLSFSIEVVSEGDNRVILGTVVYNQDMAVVLDCETVVELH